MNTAACYGPWDSMHGKMTATALGAGMQTVKGDSTRQAYSQWCYVMHD